MPSRPLRVWFSRGLSNVYDALRALREHGAPGAFTLLASHASPQAPALRLADERFLEPTRRSSDAELVDWFVETCRERRVDLFWPGRRVAALAAAKERFEAVGTRLAVPAGPEALHRIDRKDLFYADMAEVPGVALPDHHIVRTLEEFDAAWAALAARHPRLCVKPVQSTFGLGFHTFAAKDDEYARFLGGDPVPVSLDAARRAIGSAAHPRALMLMEYLPGPERSVDCLAWEGRLVTAVSRRKRGDHQVIEVGGPAVEAARAVVERYRLEGVVNVQTRDGRGEPRLLEANARMSGGLLYTTASGVSLVHEAVRLHLGLTTPAQVPTPRAGALVAPVQGMVVVEEGGEGVSVGALGRATPPRPSRALGSRALGSRTLDAAAGPDDRLDP